MEPICKGAGRVKGTEVLFFPDAELEKTDGNFSSFAAAGPLSVLYFKDYDRFVLRLDGWKYPLMQRLPFLGLDKNGVNSRSYSFPAANGYYYNLTINSNGSDEALGNFETILQLATKFSWKGESYHGEPEKSPDDKLARKTQKDTGMSMKEAISETLKKGIHSIKNKFGSMHSGTKNIISRKKMTNLKDIKTKNFRKEAQSSFKKDFFKSNEKISQEFLKLRGENLNLILPKSYNDLRKTSDSDAPSLYFLKEEIEDAILNNREFASLGNFNMGSTPENIPLAETIRQDIKQDLLEFKENANERKREDLSNNRSRDRNSNLNQSSAESNLNQLAGFEGMTHYEG